ncbi:NCS2 family permease [Geobacillus sp. G4]|mgnify:FL=1|uniref:Guanine permease n=6 Tax=Geobacillus TaxID=129337 RepID=A0A7U9JAP0_GEOTM|nr:MULTISPECIES: NCS2 family permease [Geobacillus]MCG6796542.1 NCS2 family permease [Geobacillus sp. YHL]AOL33242.1 guanine permease [Geobacillus thermoleovorans]AUI36637.1 NCS2 family permease [[Bacillus] caldolyticus]AWO74139.1 NCS2 family permease [Geobacillus thermoleovorans]EPR28734.1 Guanine-hypoxanthine permease [Geobacillus sp. WSUCF1]
MRKYFQFDELGTNYRTEIIAGLTTFLSMAYILFVNPFTLSLGAVKDFPDELRIDQGAVFVATALAAAYGSILMGVLARYPIALAPGMGLNAFFAFTVVLHMGIPWQTALAGVFVSGIIFTILSLTGIREKIIDAIPVELKYAVSAGIGLFITFIGLQNAGIIVDNKATLVGLSSLKDGNTLLAIFGLFITVVLMVRKVNGGVFYGMVITAIVGMIFGLIKVPHQIVGAIPDISPTFGVAIKHLPDIFSWKMLGVVLTFFIVDFFDATGTLLAVANQAGLLKNNKLPRAGKALLVDATAVMVGAVFGTSTTTSYIESSAGVAAGGRSGFSAVVTGILFLLALFFSPLLSVITAPVTAPALIIVGVLMASSIGEIDWKKFEVAVPAFFTLITMPLSYSIATGIAVGFIFYPITMILKGRGKDVHPLLYVLFVVFICYFVFLRE